MTLFGKILTVLVLCMSIGFMMLAVTVSATHRIWRDMVVQPGGLKAQIETLSKTNRELRLENSRAFDRIALEQASRRFALAAAQARLQQLEDTLQQREKEYADLQAAEGTNAETLKRNSEMFTALAKENEGLRKEIRRAQEDRDIFFNQVVTLTDKVNQMEGNSHTLQKRHDMLLAQNSKMAIWMRRLEVNVDAPIEPPRVDGIVTAVSDKNLIEISIGSDDGLRKHHFMEVYRKNYYVGRVVIVMVKPDRAVAKIIPEYRRGIIKKDDRVATKLG